MRSVSKPVTEGSEKPGRILFTKVASGQLRPVHQAAPPLLASTGAPWHDVLKLEQHQIPAREVPESSPCEHLLAMRLGPRGQCAASLPTPGPMPKGKYLVTAHVKGENLSGPGSDGRSFETSSGAWPSVERSSRSSWIW